VSCNWQNPLFVYKYNLIAYKIQTNLELTEEPHSKELVKRIINGDIDVKKIASMTAKQLHPHRFKEIYNEINLRKKQKVVKKISTQHECFKCGGRKTTETELQLRSLDEGSTLIIKCEMSNCENTWRITS
jgi:DNA-directed RNA polymerase subunit M/transcription elongation factor TFIIS